MGKASVKKNKNIYQLTREELGLSRAEATERIPNDPKYPGMPGVPEYKLVKIENGHCKGKKDRVGIILI